MILFEMLFSIFLDPPFAQMVVRLGLACRILVQTMRQVMLFNG